MVAIRDAGISNHRLHQLAVTRQGLHRDQIAVLLRGRQILAVMDELAGIMRNTSL